MAKKKLYLIRRLILWLISISLIFLAQSCKKFSEVNLDLRSEDAVARVYDQYLYRSDLSGLAPSNASQADSTAILERYIDSWIRQQLLVQNAQKNVSINEAEIERRVQDYRFQLIMYAYERQYIENNLDTTVTAEQIKSYYEEYKDSFTLKENIIRGIYLKVSKDAPQSRKVKQWMSANSREGKEKLKSYAYSYADKAVLDDSLWINFNDVIANTPFVDELGNKAEVLKADRLFQASDSNYLYYIKIIDFKTVDQVSPIEFVSNQIRDIIISKRKIDIRKQHENDVFEQAKQSKAYEIFSK